MASQFRNLVFEGGGVKGIAYAGAIQVLEDRGILADIKRVGGTSAGAITATLLALGVDSRKLEGILAGTDFHQFMQRSFLFIRELANLRDEYGWYGGEEFEAWLADRILDAAGTRDLTFAELRAKVQAGAPGFRDLYVVGTDLTMQDFRLYSHEGTPDMPIREAVRISMSIPLFFKAVIKNGHVLIDGGVTYNYPLDLFDDRKYLDVADPKKVKVVDYPTRYNEDHVFNKETLGFRVDTFDEIKEELEGEKKAIPIKDFIDYSKALLNFIMETAGKVHLHGNDWHRTVYIDAKGIRTTDFDLTKDDMDMLVQSGRDGAINYFKWFGNKRAKVKAVNRL